MEERVIRRRSRRAGIQIHPHLALARHRLLAHDQVSRPVVVPVRQRRHGIALDLDITATDLDVLLGAERRQADDK